MSLSCLPISNQPRALRDDALLNGVYAGSLRRRQEYCAVYKQRMLAEQGLLDFADWHLYFGLHRLPGGDWIFREWLPAASAVFLLGDFNAWQAKPAYALQAVDDGVWELRLPAESLRHGQQYRLLLQSEKGDFWRLPSAARRTLRRKNAAGEVFFNAQVWEPQPYAWRHEHPVFSQALLVYEAHVGMAQSEAKIGSFAEFTAELLPRIVESGYNCLQLMALAQHPYYASFGYQVSNFFAPCDLFGSPEELKLLVDQAHGLGLLVIMDLVHAHTVRNSLEGLGELDGSRYPFFHAGTRGEHPAWGSYCFDYGNRQCCRFLLSNCRYWLEEFRMDGFRFDGVTSMLYKDHGLGRNFVSYDDYFSDNVDEDAYAYLGLANELLKLCRPQALSIAEDVSGMPGLGASREEGGAGFDFRLAMGVSDHWFFLLDRLEQKWNMARLWHELSNRRQDERSISYVECHDQSLVGGQTFLFRCLGERMYDSMHLDSESTVVDRGLALHKLARLATLASAGHGYLNFMGNEFGHPEWIDFPREGNDWSLHYARRRWELAENPNLRFMQLLNFEKAMLKIVNKQADFFHRRTQLLKIDEERQLLIFERADLVFAFNFHAQQSCADYCFSVRPGSYKLLLDSDRKQFGGWQRIEEGQTFFSKPEVMRGGMENRLSVYLPSGCALVLEKRREDTKTH